MNNKQEHHGSGDNVEGGKHIYHNTHLLSTQLAEVTEIVHQFKNVTALSRLEKIEANLQISNLPEQDKKKYLAQIFYLKALSLQFNPKADDEPNKLFIKAYEHQPNNLHYKERACTSFFTLELQGKSLSLAKEILKEASLNPRGWAIQTFLDEGITLEDVPSVVRKDKVFKNIYLYLHFKVKRNIDALSFLKEDIDKKEPPQEITLENLTYWKLIVSHLMNKVTTEHPNDLSHKKTDYLGNLELDFVHQILKVFHHTFSETELVKNPSIQYYFVLAHYVEYLINGSKEAIANAYEILLQTKEHIFRPLLPLVLVSLSQVQEDDKVLKLVDVWGYIHDDIYGLVATTYMNLGNIAKASELNKQYLKRKPEIKSYKTEYILQIIDIAYENGENLELLYEEYLRDLSFANSYDKTLVDTYVDQANPQKKHQVRKQATTLFDNLNHLNLVQRQYLAVVLRKVGLIAESNQVLESFLDETQVSKFLLLYIENLENLKSDTSKELQLLKFLRESNYFHEGFIRIELELLALLNHYEEYEEVAKIACKKFPDKPVFLTNLLKSLSFRHKNDELDLLLNESLLTKDFQPYQAFEVANICIERGKHAIALTLLYDTTLKNKGDSMVLLAYMNTLLPRSFPDDLFEKPVQATEGTYVEIVVQGTNTRKVIELSAENINKNSNYEKAILGKKAGDKVFFSRKLTGKSKSFVITQILNKYRGLQLWAMTELQQNPPLDLPMETIDIGSANEDIEEINKILIENFGLQGEERKIKREAQFDKYDQGMLSFTDLVRFAVQDSDPIQLYDYLTSDYSNGFWVVPITNFDQLNLSPQTGFVVDLTIIPLLCDLQKELKIGFSKKFIISQFVVYHLENCLKNARLSPDEEISLNIGNKVRPMVHTIDHKQHKINRYQELIDWVKKNCEVKTTEQHANLIRKVKKGKNEFDWYKEYVTDTLLLIYELQHREYILVSDDSNFLNLKGGVAYSSEFLLRETQTNIFDDQILPFLIGKNYKGISIKSQHLINEFENLKAGSPNNYYKCINNLPFKVSNNFVFFECLKFIKYLHLSDYLAIKEKKRVSTSIFQEVLKGFELDDDAIRRIKIDIQKTFHLLPIHEKRVIQSLEDAIRNLGSG